MNNWEKLNKLMKEQIVLLESLKPTEEENNPYKKMWEEFERLWFGEEDFSYEVDEWIGDTIDKLEEKYLGEE